MNEESPFVLLKDQQGDQICERSSLCTWVNDTADQTLPYCFLHDIDCTPDLMGCYTESTCGHHITPPPAPAVPIIILPPAQVVQQTTAPSPTILSVTSAPSSIRRKSHHHNIIIIIIIILSATSFICVFLYWSLISYLKSTKSNVQV
jgi:hypothetical protein